MQGRECCAKNINSISQKVKKKGILFNNRFQIFSKKAPFSDEARYFLYSYIVLLA